MKIVPWLRSRIMITCRYVRREREIPSHHRIQDRLLRRRQVFGNSILVAFECRWIGGDG